MANRKNPSPDLGTPPQQYDQTFMLTMIRKLESFMGELKTPGQAVEGSISLIACPTSGGGLRPGDVWVDANSHLRMVQVSDNMATGAAIRILIGKAVAA